MLTKLVFKILFKALVPIVCLVGIMSYGLYMQGGDPAALFGKIAGGAFNNMKSSVKDAGQSVQNAGKVATGNNKTTVYKWVDENGVTQFGSAPPEHGSSETLTLKDNYKGVAPATAKTQTAQPAQHNGLGPDGKPLPGVAGMNLPTSVDPAVLNGFLQTMQQREQ